MIIFVQKNMRSSLLLLLIIFSFSLLAQQKCGTTIKEDLLKEKYPQYQSSREVVNYETNKWLMNNDTDNLKSIITIPVVVHVVYNTNAENISDAQIFSQMDVLNADFRRTNSDASNTPSVWQNIAADCEIDFCLATIDPNGNPTTGITRTNTNQTSFSISSDNVKYSSAGGIDPWPQDDYLNIWVCDLGGGLLGYATPPSNWTNPEDGVVIGYRYFGTTGVVQAPYNKGRTATHEVGHWLNLDHVWGDNNCGNDQCGDTPVQQAPNYGCPSFPSTSNCTGNGTSGDMYMNYMDYTNDACMNLFTNDQKSRMIAAINQYRSNLLNHNLCTGSTNPSSWNCINDNCVDPGDGSGSYSSYNSCYSDCECSGDIFEINEGFQSSSLPNGWSVDNPDGSETWVVNSNYGFNSSSSIFIENSIYSANGQYDDLNSPTFSFLDASTVSLRFDYAYSLWTDPTLSQNWSDTLIVLVSSDCGVTWEKIWERAGNALVTTTPNYNGFEWYPSGNNDWNSANVNLNTYAGSDGVIVKFRNVNQYENNLFLDNINITSDATTNIEESNINTKIFPNPASDKIIVEFDGLKEIYTVLGKKILVTKNRIIDISSLESGIYLIRTNNLDFRFIKH